MKIREGSLWVAVLFGAATLTPRVAGALSDGTVTAVGQAAIYNGDKANARDKAIDDAKRKAIEQAVGAVVTSETITKNYQLLSDKIFSKSKGFINNYKVVSEKVDGGVYVVTIEANVQTAAIANEVDRVLSVLRSKNLPRVLLMISEQNVGSAKTSAWWAGEESFAIDLGAAENAFVDMLTQKGFRFVDRQALQGNITAASAVKGAAYSAQQVKSFAGATGAEVAIYGSAVATDNGTIMNTKMHSLRANISLKAILIDTAEILATATVTAAVPYIDPITGGTQALDKAARLAANQLQKKIIDRWETEAAGATTIALTIHGVKRSKYLRKISAFLGNEVRGVKGVRQRSYRKKIAKIEVDLEGSSQHLAEELEEKKFGGFNIEIDEITANTVTAVLSAK